MSNQNQAVLPRRSRRLATLIPASHWSSIGYTEEVAVAMEKLQIDMKRMYDGDGLEEKEGDLILNLLWMEDDNECLRIPYDELMLPHWKKFANEIKKTTVNDITIGCIKLPLPILDVIFPAFQSMTLTKMILFNADMRNEGLLCLSSFLRGNTSLQVLVIAFENIVDLPVACTLSDAIDDHPTLRAIGLISCGIGNNAGILAKVLTGCTRMAAVNILSDNIRSEGTAVISEFIAHNHPAVKEIKLSNNDISDSDTAILSAALKRNTFITGLDICRNDVTEEGERHMRRALFDTTTLNSVVESNHTSAYLIHPEAERNRISSLDAAITEINLGGPLRNDTTEQRIRKKVILALSGLDGELFNLHYFNDLPLQLMPRVLELLQEHAEFRIRRYCEFHLEIEALSRLFHTLRGWELPLLFENLSPVAATETRKRKMRGARR